MPEEYGGMDTHALAGSARESQARRLKDLERENTRLKTVYDRVADLALDQSMLEEALSKKESARPGVVSSWSTSWRSWTCPSGGPAGS